MSRRRSAVVENRKTIAAEVRRVVELPARASWFVGCQFLKMLSSDDILELS